MQQEGVPSQTERRGLAVRPALVICSLIILAGAAALWIIFSTEPEATRTAASRQSAMPVDTVRADKGEYRPVIEVIGTVTPERAIELRAQVEGEIVSRAREFTPGGFVEKGEILAQIDPRDYRNILEQRESQLERALSDLRIEMGRQDVARQDFRQLDEELPEEKRALVLRDPQLQAARAAVKDARAAADQAEVELERTKIRAPFDARVLSREADLGSHVSSGQNLGRLAGTDVFRVEASVPVSALGMLSFPDRDGGKGSEVRVRNRTAWQEGSYRTGRLHRLVGELDEKTRLARVIAHVDDPLALEKSCSGAPPLIINSIVQVRINGRSIKDVIRINRDYVRKDDTVWVMKDGKLDIRDPEIVFKDPEHVYIKQGVKDGEQVVTSGLATVAQGARLRQKDDGEGGEPGERREETGNREEKEGGTDR